MDDETKIRLALVGATIVSIVTSLTAIVVAFWNARHSSKQQRLTRYAERLTQQLQNLYGPLHFWTQHNKQLWANQDTLHELYRTEYIEPQFSDEDSTQKELEKQTTETIVIMNKYTDKCLQNNARMVRVITRNYAYIDPDDAQLLQELVNDWNRWKMEKGLPYRIASKAGPVIFTRLEVVERIEQRVRQLNDDLRKVTAPSKGWFQSLWGTITKRRAVICTESKKAS